MTRIAIAMVALCWAVMGCAGTDEVSDGPSGDSSIEIATGTDQDVVTEFVDGIEHTISITFVNDDSPATDEELAAMGDTDKTSAATGYGLEVDGVIVRCSLPWAGGLCRVPQSKDVKLSNSCAGCSTDQINSMAQIASFWQTELTARGWTPHAVSPGAVGEYAQVKSGAVASGDTSIVLNLKTSLDQPGPGGTYRKITNCQATVDFAKDVAQITAHPPDVQGGCGSGTACRLNTFQNHGKFALGACMAIAKGSDRNSFMSGPNWAAISQQLNATERIYLNTYIP